jgi:hypothetical protein
LDYSEVDGYTDVIGRYTDTERIRSHATQTVRTNFAAYNVRVLNWGAAQHKAGLDAARGVAKDKTIHILQNKLAIGNCLEDSWGCAPLNGPAGHAFYQDLLNNVPPLGLRRARWRGDNNDAIGELLGLTISHEAGHTYGIDHANSGIMNPNTTLRQRLHLNWRDEKAKKRLNEVLGPKQP